MSNFGTNFFNKLKTLVLMQLKNKVDFSFLKNKKTTFFKIAYSLILFALLTTAIYFVYYIVVNFHLFSLGNNFNFYALLVLFVILIVLNLFSTIITTTKTLYFSKDNPVLLTLPANTNLIFISKLIVVLIYELIKNINYMLPFFIAYGLIMKLHFAYYFWIVFTIIILTITIVVISGLLSIPSMFIATKLRGNRVAKIVTIATVITLSVLAVIKLIKLIPSNINLVGSGNKIYWQIQIFLNNFAFYTSPIKYLLQFITGMTYGSNAFSLLRLDILFTFISLFLINVLGLVIINFTSKPLFFKMASSPFEFKKKEIRKQKKNKYLSKFISAVIIETKKTIRNSNCFYTVLAVCILAPILVLFENQVVSAMDTRIFGINLCLVFNILIVLLLLMSSNANIASIYSREGNSAYLNKVNPVKYSKILFAKLLFYIVATNISIIISVVVMNTFNFIGVVNCIMLSLAMMAVNTAHTLWSAELDVMNPQNQQYQTTGEHIKNPNETKSTIIAFVSAFLFSFVSFFLLNENSNVVYIKILALAVIFLVFRCYLFVTRINLFYKEK